MKLGFLVDALTHYNEWRSELCTAIPQAWFFNPIIASYDEDNLALVYEWIMHRGVQRFGYVDEGNRFRVNTRNLSVTSRTHTEDI